MASHLAAPASQGLAPAASSSSSSQSTYAKYANLPDVDVSAPDVYESATAQSKTSRSSDPTKSKSRRDKHRSQNSLYDDDDDDDQDSDYSSDDSESTRKHRGSANASTANENIDSTSLRLTDAASKFGNATDIDTAKTDFSGRLKSQRRSKKIGGSRPKDAGFETDIYALDTAGRLMQSEASSSSSRESAIDRLRRLKFEASQLEEELANGTATGAGNNRSEPQSQDLLAQLKVLQSQLQTLEGSSASSADDAGASRTAGAVSERSFQSLLQQLSIVSSGATAATLTSTTATATDGAGSAVLPSAQTILAGTATSSKSNEAVLLDSRLTELETALGLKEAVLDEWKPVPRPILSTLSRLEYQLSLLSQPRHLDGISRRVKVLVSEMERVHDIRRKLTGSSSSGPASGGAATSADESGNASSSTSTPGKTSLTSADIAKLEQLYTVSTRVEPLLPLVPTILDRLQTLGDLHASAARFKDSLDDIEAGKDARTTQMEELETLLGKVETNLADNSAKVQANLDSLHQRIADVSGRLERLQ
ncbi:hypothetical protein BCV70DRAFT_199558 [Testicularia cyperi]|uniref:Dynamitin-domain-containing protein n=1 Tax=Testicularia cyperi TaxID=1882483 RepID=A0A317XTF5_9BASI|nr:hypothetical protein BCV70DRAFT_199558 [Testicularia cyperi]